MESIQWRQDRAEFGRKRHRKICINNKGHYNYHEELDIVYGKWKLWVWPKKAGKKQYVNFNDSILAVFRGMGMYIKCI